MIDDMLGGIDMDVSHMIIKISEFEQVLDLSSHSVKIWIYFWHLFAAFSVLASLCISYVMLWEGQAINACITFLKKDLTDLCLSLTTPLKE